MKVLKRIKKKFKNAVKLESPNFLFTTEDLDAYIKSLKSKSIIKSKSAESILNLDINEYNTIPKLS